MIIGVSTSSYQIEGENFYSDWYYFENLKKVPTCGSACNFWKNYKEFIDLMRKFHIKWHRMSIEWSRIYKDKGKVDTSALKRYKEIVSYHINNGVNVMLTLWHFSNPIWYANLGGWKYRENIDYFLEYVQEISRNFDVKYWITLNEFLLYFFAGYIFSIWPPFERKERIRRLIREMIFRKRGVIKNFEYAHKEAYKILKEQDSERIVGYSMNFIKLSHFPIVADIYLHLTLRFSPKITDFYGVNYYGAAPITKRIEERPLIPLPDKMEPIIKKIKRKFRDIPIIITENGISTNNELERAKYIVDHLYELYKIKDKYNVIGYFYWSFCDNYEWEAGYTPKFGLFTRDLKPKLSAYIFKSLIDWASRNIS